MSFPNSQLDDDIVKFLNDNVIINDVEWDGKVLEINESDLSQIHSECSSARTTPHVQTPASDSKEAWIGGIEGKFGNFVIFFGNLFSLKFGKHVA